MKEVVLSKLGPGEQEFQNHLKLLTDELSEHWSPLPGLGDPLARNNGIQDAINSANKRAGAWELRWSIEQEVQHLHAIVEALGAMANNISHVSTLFCMDEAAQWDQLKFHFQADLEGILENAKNCHYRSRVLVRAAHPNQVPYFVVHSISISVELLGIRSIILADNFSSRKNSIQNGKSEEIIKFARTILRNIDQYRSYYEVRASPAWLEAKVNSVLQMAGGKTERSFQEIASDADGEPKIVLEIAKLAISDTLLLSDSYELLILVDKNIKNIIFNHGLWSEEHKRALASIQLMAHAAVMRSARIGGAEELTATGLWANAIHNWSVGNTALDRAPQRPTAHFIASDEYMGRLCTHGDRIQYDEVPIEPLFWTNIWSLHRAFDAERNGKESIGKVARRSIKNFLAPLLDLPSDSRYQIYLHGRAALVPWFTLVEDGKTWASRAVVGAAVSDDVKTSPLESQRKYLAIIDTGLGRNASEVAEAWKRYSKCSDVDIIKVDSTKAPKFSKNKILSRIQGAEEILFFGHGINQINNFRKSGLRIDRDNLITASDVSDLNMSATKCLFLIACGSGQANMSVPVSSMGELFSARGVSNVVSTLWSIQSTVGMRFIDTYLSQLLKSNNYRESWVSTLQRDASKFGYFSLSTH